IRMMRDSSPELDREWPGPYASSKITLFPRRARCSAVHAPKTPAPITATSYVFMFCKLYYRLDESKLQPCHSEGGFCPRTSSQSRVVCAIEIRFAFLPHPQLSQHFRTTLLLSFRAKWDDFFFHAAVWRVVPRSRGISLRFLSHYFFHATASVFAQ